MTTLIELPRNEILNSRVFSLTIPAFLQVLTEQLNIFIITRSAEMHKFTGQFVLIYDFLCLLSQMIEFTDDDPRFKEVYHSFSTGFLPQSIFFLAQ